MNGWMDESFFIVNFLIMFFVIFSTRAFFFNYDDLFLKKKKVLTY